MNKGNRLKSSPCPLGKYGPAAAMRHDASNTAANLTRAGQSIVIFDGVCKFCCRSIGFILRNDKTGSIVFAPMQSEAGTRLMRDHNINPDAADTFLYISNGAAYIRSDAALEVARNFGFWRLLRVFKLVPRRWRDACYCVIARHRYSWFGKFDQCYLPTSEERARFLDSVL